MVVYARCCYLNAARRKHIEMSRINVYYSIYYLGEGGGGGSCSMRCHLCGCHSRDTTVCVRLCIGGARALCNCLIIWVV